MKRQLVLVLHQRVVGEGQRLEGALPGTFGVGSLEALEADGTEADGVAGLRLKPGHSV